MENTEWDERYFRIVLALVQGQAAHKGIEYLAIPRILRKADDLYRALENHPRPALETEEDNQ